jgi:hypothetical protein
MLAGDRFSDHPKSVCRVIASFLRCYNDVIDDRRREDLYRCAAEIVGTRDSWATERVRLAACEKALLAVWRPSGPRWLRRFFHCCRTLDPAGRVTGLFGDLARALSATEDGHRRALALVDQLVSINVPPEPPCRAMSGVRDPALASRRVAAISSSRRSIGAARRSDHQPKSTGNANAMSPSPPIGVPITTADLAKDEASTRK